MLDDFDETVDDCRIVARVSRAATFCARLSHAVRTRKGKRFTDVHDLFGKRARLRPKARTQEDETTYTFPELLLGTALLNVPYSVWEARDFFASVGGKVGQPADLGALEGIFVAFWLEVAARRGKYRDPDDEPAWADCKSPVRSRRPAVLRCLHAVDATRVHRTRSWVFSFLISSAFGPSRVTAMLHTGSMARRRPVEAVL